MSRQIQGLLLKVMRRNSECEINDEVRFYTDNVRPHFLLSRSPNASLHRAHHIAPLLWLGDFRCSLPVVQRQFVGLGMRLLPTYCRSLTGLSAQTYNSLSQSPCEVAAYLQSTCWQGGRCSPCVYENGLIISCRVRSLGPPVAMGVHRPA